MQQRDIALIAGLLLAIHVDAQSVLSVRAGLIHRTEGAVFLNGEALVQSVARFPSMAKDGTLRTQAGRAEVLLTPGVFLWLGPNSELRLLSSSLVDARVELLSGSAVIESERVLPGGAVTILAHGWDVTISAGSHCRLNSNPWELRVLQGRTEVSRRARRMLVPEQSGFSLMSGTPATLAATDDVLDQWAAERRKELAAENKLRAKASAPSSGSIRRAPGPPVVPHRAW